MKGHRADGGEWRFMPNVRPLANKPLVEAIMELRWELPPNDADPHLSLLPGRLYERLRNVYPVHEALPSAMIPAAAIPHVVQHRFRTSQNAWPLVQLGSGIVTLNDTTKYAWADFGQRAKDLVKTLYEIYPEPQSLKLKNVILRYIDAIEFDYGRQDVLVFLRDKLKTSIGLPPQLFEGVSVLPRPEGFSFQSAFPVESPAGSISVRFATGVRDGKRSLIWETTMKSEGSQIEGTPPNFEPWVESAHALTDDWFFKLIEGELERRFE